MSRMPEDKWSVELAEPIEMVAIDIDGTLLRSTKQISFDVIDTIRAANRRGVRVVLASARPPRSVREIYGHLQLQTAQINYNGALIFDPVRDEAIYHRPLDGPLAREIVSLARQIEPGIVVSIEILDRWYTDRVDPALLTETAKTHRPDYVGPLNEHLNDPITKLMLLAPAQRLEPVKARIVEQFAERIGVAVSDPHLMQIVHPTVDKAAALEMIARQYEVPQSRVMAIGDAPNDAGMLRWAGLGVAVKNAWQETIDAADIVAPSNDEDGVAVAIKKYVLGQG